MNRFERRPVDTGEAKIEFLDGDFRILRPGAYRALRRYRRADPSRRVALLERGSSGGLRHSGCVDEARVRAPLALPRLPPSVFLMDSSPQGQPPSPRASVTGTPTSSQSASSQKQAKQGLRICCAPPNRHFQRIRPKIQDRGPKSCRVRQSRPRTDSARLSISRRTHRDRYLVQEFIIHILNCHTSYSTACLRSLRIRLSCILRVRRPMGGAAASCVSSQREPSAPNSTENASGGFPRPALPFASMPPCTRDLQTGGSKSLIRGPARIFKPQKPRSRADGLKPTASRVIELAGRIECRLRSTVD